MAAATEATLRITEIFYSLQGETHTSGYPTVFVRLTGCPLRCQYCDSEYAFKGGKVISLDDIISQVQNFAPSFVTVTGGEPLAQPNCLPLLSRLCDLGYTVGLETSNALDISRVDPRVEIILDLKTPGSAEVSKNLWTNLEHLKAKDKLKFVICNQEDFVWAKTKIAEHNLYKICEIFLSPSADEVSPKDLAEWILAANLKVRMQLQLHKQIWGDMPGK